MTAALNRRAMLVGTCAAGCAALAGCATYSAGAPQPQVAPQPSAAPAPDPGGTAAPAPAAPPLVSTAEVPVGGGVVLTAQQVVVTQPTAGEYKAFSTTCTHQGCEVNEVADGQIVCPCHGSYFAIADGAVTDGPAESPLPEKAITVSGDSIALA
jgi:Rieske Fe-S protein